MPLGTVRTYVKRSRGALTRLGLGKSSLNHDQILCYVADRCKDLRELYFNTALVSKSLIKAAPNLSLLRNLILSTPCEIGADTAIQVLIQCRQLEHIEFPKVLGSVGLDQCDCPEMPALRVLKLNCGFDRGVFRATELVKRIPNICRLSLRGWRLLHFLNSNPGFSDLAKLESLDITGCFVTPTPELPPSLRELSMAGLQEQGTIIGYEAMTKHLPQLVSLRIPVIFQDVYTEGVTDWLEANKGNLELLDLSHSSASSQCIKALVEGGYLKSAQTICLEGCAVYDAVLEQLSQEARHLKSLDISSTQVTGVGVKYLVKGLGNTLEYLCLDHCTNTSVDAVVWARSTGLTVSFKFPDHSKKGKKVRAI